MKSTIKVALLIKGCQEYAKNKNGKIISTEYVNSHTKMLWECEKGHQWEAPWNRIKNMVSWCPKCANKLPDIKILQKFAESKNGKLISIEYKNNHTKMLWECNKKHQFLAKWNHIKDNNRWCPYCTGHMRIDIEEVKKYAIDKHGKLISMEYKNRHTKMLWECEKGHQWKANWHNIKTGKWCPECASFKTEHKCKELLEQKLGIKLNKTRFFIEDKRYKLDGYNEEHKIAFEYHGYQHYIYPNHFHKTKEQFKKAQQRDLDKIQYAKDKGIRLIIIPCSENANLETCINSQLELLRINRII